MAVEIRSDSATQGSHPHKTWAEWASDITSSAYEGIKNCAQNPYVQETAFVGAAALCIIVSRGKLIGAAEKFLPRASAVLEEDEALLQSLRNAGEVARVDLIGSQKLGEEEVPSVSEIHEKIARIKALRNSVEDGSAAVPAEIPRKRMNFVEKNSHVVQLDLPAAADAAIIRSLDSVPFGFQLLKSAKGYREFLLTEGEVSNPFKWHEATTIHDDHSVVSFFKAREMFPDETNTTSKLGPEIKMLFQHFDGNPVFLDQKLAEKADVIACCHPDRIAPVHKAPHILQNAKAASFKAKHVLPEHVGQIIMYPTRDVFSLVPSGQALLVVTRL